MIDFTNARVTNKAYAGANGSKISILYNNEIYMLKFPQHPKLNDNISYTNGCISEYMGCRIFDSVGIPAQETILGTYSRKEKEYIVVACKDFTSPGIVLQDFASMKNTVVDSESNGYGTELSDILFSIEKQTLINPEVLRERFWDMFIVDALIGNWDRHNGNWGVLYNTVSDAVELAPIYDCGSALYPQADESIMKLSLEIKAERDLRIFSRPLSAVTLEGKKINYFDFISSLQNPDCNAALKRIAPRIDMNKISDIIENTPYTSDLQKSFYITMLKERKARIIDFSLNALKKNESLHSKTRHDLDR